MLIFFRFSVLYADHHNKSLMLCVVMLNIVMLNVVMLNVVMLTVVMLNVVMLNVVAPIFFVPRLCRTKPFFLETKWLVEAKKTTF
jgi:hypothetical protein